MNTDMVSGGGEMRGKLKAFIEGEKDPISFSP